MSKGVVEVEHQFDLQMMAELDAYVLKKLGGRTDTVAITQVCWTLIGLAANTWKVRGRPDFHTDELFLELARAALGEVPAHLANRIRDQA